MATNAHVARGHTTSTRTSGRLTERGAVLGFATSSSGCVVLSSLPMLRSLEESTDGRPRRWSIAPKSAV